MSHSKDRPDDPGRGQALARLLASAPLAHVVPRLAPELLHRLVEQRGLADSGELLAHATPTQWARLFDLDLWRARGAGGDEAFDASRFAEWLEVMADLGPEAAAA